MSVEFEEKVALVLSIAVLERALAAAFVSHHFKVSTLRLIKEGQHQAAFNAPINKSSGDHTSRSSLEYRRIPDFDVRVSRSGQCSAKLRFPSDDVLELKGAICLFLFHWGFLNSLKNTRRTLGGTDQLSQPGPQHGGLLLCSPIVIV